MSKDHIIEAHARVAEPSPVVSALASAAILSGNGASVDRGQGVRASVIRRLVSATLRPGAFSAEMLLAALADNRVAHDQIVDTYIPHAARHLGAMWCDDTIGFADVTIATARLQSLLTLLAPPCSTAPSDRTDAPAVLFVLQDSDTHTLGPHVAAAQLRRMGASVRLLFGPEDATVLRAMDADSYDLLMFSCARATALASIRETVRLVRGATGPDPFFVLGGIVLELTDRIGEKTGVDLVTRDVRAALRLSAGTTPKPGSVAL
jgi:methylmalonyl-CoA mutase cobalamin-binding subunit